MSSWLDKELESARVEAKSKPKPPPADAGCPSCGGPMAFGALVCVKCGYDTRIRGRRSVERVTEDDSTKKRSPLGSAFAAGFSFSSAIMRLHYISRRARYADRQRAGTPVWVYLPRRCSVVSIKRSFHRSEGVGTGWNRDWAGAFGFGHVQDRIGHVRTLVITLIGWLIAVVLAWTAESVAMFWVVANLVGICLGSSQSAGRALVGYLSPPARTAEFFGLWGLAVKLSSILGPLTYGAVTWMTQGNHRLAILVTGLFFVIGLAILAGLNPARGRAAALNDVP